MKEDFRSGFVSIIGRPNAGKSTLLNRLVGQKVAIISDKPQTTRNKIIGVSTGPDYQAVFLDTPGIHKPRHLLGEYMVSEALGTFAEVDAVLYVVDAAANPGSGEEYILEHLKQIKTPVILVLNKIDLVSNDNLLRRESFFQRHLDFTGIQKVSALEGTNIEDLSGMIVSLLEPGPMYYPPGMVTDQPESFVISELIREQVLRSTHEEVPHATAVVVEEITQRSNDLLYIDAVIYIERESQKGIIIGKEGQRLKEIGSSVRREIEVLFGSKIYLELRVRVKKNWRRQEQYLHQMGYFRHRSSRKPV